MMNAVSNLIGGHKKEETVNTANLGAAGETPYPGSASPYNTDSVGSVDPTGTNVTSGYYATPGGEAWTATSANTGATTYDSTSAALPTHHTRDNAVSNIGGYNSSSAGIDNTPVAVLDDSANRPHTTAKGVAASAATTAGALANQAATAATTVAHEVYPIAQNLAAQAQATATSVFTSAKGMLAGALHKSPAHTTEASSLTTENDGIAPGRTYEPVVGSTNAGRDYTGGVDNLSLSDNAASNNVVGSPTSGGRLAGVKNTLYNATAGAAATTAAGLAATADTLNRRAQGVKTYEGEEFVESEHVKAHPDRLAPVKNAAAGALGVVAGGAAFAANKLDNAFGRNTTATGTTGTTAANLSSTDNAYTTSPAAIDAIGSTPIASSEYASGTTGYASGTTGITDSNYVSSSGAYPGSTTTTTSSAYPVEGSATSYGVDVNERKAPVDRLSPVKNAVAGAAGAAAGAAALAEDKISNLLHHNKGTHTTANTSALGYDNYSTKDSAYPVNTTGSPSTFPTAESGTTYTSGGTGISPADAKYSQVGTPNFVPAPGVTPVSATTYASSTAPYTTTSGNTGLSSGMGAAALAAGAAGLAGHGRHHHDTNVADYTTTGSQGYASSAERGLGDNAGISSVPNTLGGSSGITSVTNTSGYNTTGAGISTVPVADTTGYNTTSTTTTGTGLTGTHAAPQAFTMGGKNNDKYAIIPETDTSNLHAGDTFDAIKVPIHKDASAAPGERAYAPNAGLLGKAGAKTERVAVTVDTEGLSPLYAHLSELPNHGNPRARDITSIPQHDYQPTQSLYTNLVHTGEGPLHAHLSNPNATTGTHEAHHGGILSKLTSCLHHPATGSTELHPAEVRR